MSPGEIDAPAGLGFLTGVASRVGLSPGDAVAVAFAEAEGDSAGVADLSALGSGVGEAFFFFLLVGEGDAEGFGVGVSEGERLALGDGFVLFFRFGVELGVGVGESSDFGAAEGDAFGFGVAVGVGELLDFFAAELERFFFGAGVGSKSFFSLSPNPSSARSSGVTLASANTQASSATARRPSRPNITSPVPAGSLC
ncbi:MAG: hypothetical protein M3Y80_00230 [Verrucomicrobiota bacterium]|nr:hypothetical protein [Verrucomicrobiota bacterium]